MLCNLSVGPSLARGTFGTEGTCTVAVGMLPPVPLSLVFVSQGNGTSRCLSRFGSRLLRAVLQWFVSLCGSVSEII